VAKGKKPPNAGKGRKPGVPNRATAAARNVFQALLDANQDKLQAVLHEAHKSDKARWWGMMMDLSEYVVPKLARTEITGEIGVRGKLTIVR